MKRALINVGDTGPLDSLVYMLEAIGYECHLLTPQMQDRLRRAGCDCVLDISDLIRGMGYPPSDYRLPRSYWSTRFDLFVDLKAHRNYSILTQLFPDMASKILWYRINGGEPEHVIKDGKDMGNELNPPCPILTPNQWYRGWKLRHSALTVDSETGLVSCSNCKTGEAGLDETACKAYPFWPHFKASYRFKLPRQHQAYEPPVCLIHNAAGWGYGELINLLRDRIGLRVYGRGSPDGLVRNEQIPEILSKTIAMIHLKSSDAPGYALYEAIYSHCPVIASRRLVWRCNMQKLFYQPQQNCYLFDRETHESMSKAEAEVCFGEIMQALSELRELNNNKVAGYILNRRLNQLVWDSTEVNDISSFRRFMEFNFGASHGS